MSLAVCIAPLDQSFPPSAVDRRPASRSPDTKLSLAHSFCAKSARQTAATFWYSMRLFKYGTVPKLMGTLYTLTTRVVSGLVDATVDPPRYTHPDVGVAVRRWGAIVRVK